KRPASLDKVPVLSDNERIHTRCRNCRKGCVEFRFIDMSKSDEHVLACIKGWVWSGYYSADAINKRIDDILDASCDEKALRGAIVPELEQIPIRRDHSQRRRRSSSILAV